MLNVTKDLELETSGENIKKICNLNIIKEWNYRKKDIFKSNISEIQIAAASPSSGSSSLNLDRLLTLFCSKNNKSIISELI